MKNGKTYRSKSEWKKLVDQWRRSGKSQRQFAQERGVCLSSLSARARQMSKEQKMRVQGQGPASFSRVVVAQPQDEQATGIIEVTTPTGFVVRVTGEMAPKALRAVLEQVRQC
jgi:hypothetical protein